MSEGSVGSMGLFLYKEGLAGAHSDPQGLQLQLAMGLLSGHSSSVLCSQVLPEVGEKRRCFVCIIRCGVRNC